MPDALKSGPESGAENPVFLEGPSFDRQGNLYCVDIYNSRILRITPDRQWSIAARYDGHPNGLKIRRDGQIFITDRRLGVMHLDPLSGKVRPHCIGYGFETSFKGVNDLIFASNGDMYFTDQGDTGLHDPTGRVFRLRTDGRLDLVLGNVPSPNGIVLTLDETTLLVAATRANAVWRVPMLADTGAPYRVGVFLHLSGSDRVGPDGLALDADGSLAVAMPGLGSVWLFSSVGEPLFRIRSPVGKKTTNLAYGGIDNKSLFITEADSASILKIDLPVAGRPMYSHQ